MGALPEEDVAGRIVGVQKPRFVHPRCEAGEGAEDVLPTVNAAAPELVEVAVVGHLLADEVAAAEQSALPFDEAGQRCGRLDARLTEAQRIVVGASSLGGTEERVDET